MWVEGGGQAAVAAAVDGKDGEVGVGDVREMGLGGVVWKHHTTPGWRAAVRMSTSNHRSEEGSKRVRTGT